MADVKFFLDTNALIRLAGLKSLNLQDFKTRIEACNSRLSATHIQVDEMHTKGLQNYQQKVKKALESLTNKGIGVQVEISRIGVWGVSRWGLFRWRDKQTGELYEKLCKEIDECMKSKGNLI